MLEVVEADLSLPTHATALVQLLDSYARDPMGGGEGLSTEVQRQLPVELAQRSYAHVVIAFVDEQPAGLIVCFEGFSTFQCKPLMNIHDVVVAPPYRRQGISQRLLQKVEELAIARGCCKLTLEVLAGNHPAQAAYKSFGFSGYELDPQMGQALFWEKKLTPGSIKQAVPGS